MGLRACFYFYRRSLWGRGERDEETVSDGVGLYQPVGHWTSYISHHSIPIPPQPNPIEVQQLICDCDRQLAASVIIMPRRSRSATPGERERRRSRSRSRSRERSYKLPEGVSEISESDYFLKSDEFRIWLKEEKDRASRSYDPLWG